MVPSAVGPGRSGRGRRTSAAPGRPPPAMPATERFRTADPYRVEREWTRYEGTPQRELWRELRERFLARHSGPAPWVLDLGSGPGRFTQNLGDATSRRIALDISEEMLRAVKAHWKHAGLSAPLPDRVRADGRYPPFPPGSFGVVAVLGNTLGFAGASAERLREAAGALVAPGGILILEVAPGPGERSRYLARLPPTSLARLLRAPVGALMPKLEKEGFDRMPFRRSHDGEFRRISVAELRGALGPGWEVRDVMAVAPALGPMTSRIGLVRSDEKAWEHLLLLEEELGRRAERWIDAAAVLMAAHAPADKYH
jgi:SAM-dependent methyltransferase